MMDEPGHEIYMKYISVVDITASSARELNGHYGIMKWSDWETRTKAKMKKNTEQKPNTKNHFNLMKSLGHRP